MKGLYAIIQDYGITKLGNRMINRSRIEWYLFNCLVLRMQLYDCNNANNNLNGNGSSVRIRAQLLLVAEHVT